MEMILALVVVIAVLIFGALISMGNERQRRSIDGLRDQVVLWAVQDLSIKRESLIQSLKIEEPNKWLSSIASKVVGFKINLEFVEFYDEPKILVCSDDQNQIIAIFTPLAPDKIKKIKQERKNRVSNLANNPLLSLPNNADSFKVSVLNGGIMFDKELSLVWDRLTGKNINAEVIWIYISNKFH